MDWFTIPDRAGDMTGSAFAGTIMDLPSGDVRERAIFEQFELGNVPDFMRQPMALSVPEHAVELFVLPDVLCIGTDEDFLRVSLKAATLQKVADLFAATLITPFISDLIWKQADVIIDPMHVTMPPTKQMSSTRWFVDQNEKIEKERAGRTGSIAGHKKDIVLANSLLEFPHAVAIYGLHKRDGRPIQGLNPSKGIPPSHIHDRDYDDYSHGGRLGSELLYVSGQQVAFTDAAINPALAPAVNGAYGVLKVLRYAA